MKVHRYHPEAQDELLSQVAYYEAEQPDLGLRFIEAVEAALNLVGAFPKSGSPYLHRTRRVFPNKFPFSIVYLERADELAVIAVAAQSRKPGYWRKRSFGNEGQKKS